jgi:hypothetical protein
MVLAYVSFKYYVARISRGQKGLLKYDDTENQGIHRISILFLIKYQYK